LADPARRARLCRRCDGVDGRVGAPSRSPRKRFRALGGARARPRLRGDDGASGALARRLTDAAAPAVDDVEELVENTDRADRGDSHVLSTRSLEDEHRAPSEPVGLAPAYPHRFDLARPQFRVLPPTAHGALEDETVSLDLEPAGVGRLAVLAPEDAVAHALIVRHSGVARIRSRAVPAAGNPQPADDRRCEDERDELHRSTR